MSHGAGKYDAAATLVMENTEAALVAVAVVGGNNGNGFSVQTRVPAMLQHLPKILRSMADQIEKDVGHASH